MMNTEFGRDAAGRTRVASLSGVPCSSRILPSCASFVPNVMRALHFEFQCVTVICSNRWQQQQQTYAREQFTPTRQQ
jgi:hypothetical protein